jgi:hypothetical protein
MIRKDNIPEIAICHQCGEPMRVVDVGALAKSLGYQLPRGSYAVECCGFELTVDDPDKAKQIVEMLLEYHSQKAV